MSLVQVSKIISNSSVKIYSTRLHHHWPYMNTHIMVFWNTTYSTVLYRIIFWNVFYGVCSTSMLHMLLHGTCVMSILHVLLHCTQNVTHVVLTMFCVYFLHACLHINCKWDTLSLRYSVSSVYSVCWPALSTMTVLKEKNTVTDFEDSHCALNPPFCL